MHTCFGVQALSGGRGLGEGKLIQVIKLEGGQHACRINYDDQRSLFLEQREFKVIRFRNNDVIEFPRGGLEAIRLAILEITDRAE